MNTYDVDLQALIADSIEDHNAVKSLIAELRCLDPSDDLYAIKFEELRESVEEHASEEEDETFPEAAEALGDELTRLGTKIEECKEALMASKR